MGCCGGKKRIKVQGPFKWTLNLGLFPVAESNPLWKHEQRPHKGITLFSRRYAIWRFRYLYASVPWYNDWWAALSAWLGRKWTYCWPWARIKQADRAYAHNRREISQLRLELDLAREALLAERLHWGICALCDRWMTSSDAEWSICVMAQGRTREDAINMKLLTRTKEIGCDDPYSEGRWLELETHALFGCRQFKRRE